MKLNKIVFAFALLPMILAGCNKPQQPSGYSLVWADEFDGTSLNEQYWDYMTGNGREYGNPGWGNGELEYYKKENVSLKDGHLYITAKKEQTTVRYPGESVDTTYNYTSTRIRTTGKVAVKYGKIEARISLPAQKAMWPAFWMLPEDYTKYGSWPMCGEIDIMEANGNSDGSSTAALHYSTQTGVHNFETGTNFLEADDSIENFHTYSVIWTKAHMKFYVDEEEYLVVRRAQWGTSAVSKEENPVAPFDQKFHILLNMAVGGNYVHGDNPYADFKEAEMKVDYVRIYQLESDRTEE